MKKIIFTVICTFTSVLSYGADWVPITSSSDDKSFYFIDKDYYKYDAKSKTVDVWEQTTYKGGVNSEPFVSAKRLMRYDCLAKKYKTLASIKYGSDGSTLDVRNLPAKDFAVIFPDTVAESLWEASCKSNGKGFNFPVLKYEPKWVDLKSIGWVEP